ncbi:hypothetical protein [Clostridium baratii]
MRKEKYIVPFSSSCIVGAICAYMLISIPIIKKTLGIYEKTLIEDKKLIN